MIMGSFGKSALKPRKVLGAPRATTTLVYQEKESGNVSADTLYRFFSHLNNTMLGRQHRKT